MKSTLKQWAVAGVVAGLTALGWGQEVEITSFGRNGRLNWTNTAGHGFHTIQWSASATSGWRRGWEMLSDMEARDGQSAASVPMFYRVVWHTNRQAVVTNRVSGEVIASGDGTSTSFSGRLECTHLVPGSVVIAAGNTVLTDRGDGTLTGPGGATGTIDYRTGAWSVDTGGSPPLAGASIRARYAAVERGLSTPIPPRPPTSFRAVPGDGLVRLRWENCLDQRFEGVAIRRGASGYPSTAEDGVAVFFQSNLVAGASGTTSDSGVVNGATNFYAAFSFDRFGNYSAPALARTVAGSNALMQADLSLLARPRQQVPPGIELPATPTNIHVRLAAGNLQIIPGTNGVIVREELSDDGSGGVYFVGETGDPNIPVRGVDVLLPYDADLTTLRIRTTAIQHVPLGGFPSVAPVGRNAAPDGEDMTVELLPPPDGIVLDATGRNTDVYSADGFYRPNPVRGGDGHVLRAGHLRKYRFVRIGFVPFQWNPVTGALRAVRNLELDMSWERELGNADDRRFVLSDPVDPAQALEEALNRRQAVSWYNTIHRTAACDMVIITTQDIELNSDELDVYTTYKDKWGGISCEVVSVEAIDYYYTGDELADKIRAFLQAKHVDWGFEHVLLIGDPDPYDKYEGAADSVGSVPMKMAWPRGDGLLRYNDDNDPVYGYCPTDHYYGDLSEEWDVDDDGYAGSFLDDFTNVQFYLNEHLWTYTDYGVDFDMEVRVGRIPFDSATYVDPILERTVNYEKRDLDDDPVRRRKTVYVAMAHWSDDYGYDSLGEQLCDDFLRPAGLTAQTFYEPGADETPDITLENDQLIHSWTTDGAGLVVWAGHGSERRAKIHCDSSNLMDIDDVASLHATPRAHVIQISCQNGWPESSNHLSRRLLREHAMSTIAATRNTFFTSGQSTFPGETTNADVCYWLTKSHSRGWMTGFAIMHMRRKVEPFIKKIWMHNALTYNLYGDPTVAYEWE